VALRVLTASGPPPEGLLEAIPAVLKSVLQLVELCPNDDMVSVLEALIDRFPEAVAPSAADICTRLCQTFLAHVQGAEVGEGGGGGELEVRGPQAPYHALAATTSALIGLLQALRDVPHMYPLVEAPLLHVVRCVFSRRKVRKREPSTQEP
jgi:hypothetical protein